MAKAKRTGSEAELKVKPRRSYHSSANKGYRLATEAKTYLDAPPANPTMQDLIDLRDFAAAMCEAWCNEATRLNQLILDLEPPG